MSNKTGEPAFPTITYEHGGDSDGMSLRDYFAAKALQGLLASYGKHDLNSYKEFASDAYFAADAMLAEREK